MENKYFAELARRLRAAGITAGHPEKNRLTVLLNNQPVLSVSAGSDVFLLPAGSNNMEASELYHRVAQTADEVYAYSPSAVSHGSRWEEPPPTTFRMASLIRRTPTSNKSIGCCAECGECSGSKDAPGGRKKCQMPVNMQRH